MSRQAVSERRLLFRETPANERRGCKKIIAAKQLVIGVWCSQVWGVGKEISCPTVKFLTRGQRCLQMKISQPRQAGSEGDLRVWVLKMDDLCKKPLLLHQVEEFSWREQVQAGLFWGQFSRLCYWSRPSPRVPLGESLQGAQDNWLFIEALSSKSDISSPATLWGVREGAWVLSLRYY